MNNDAQEAAMGLLSLSPSNVPPPTPLVPLKRKHPPTTTNHNEGTVGSSFSTTATTVKRRPSSKLVHHQHQPQPPPQPQAQATATAPAPEGDVSTEAISCICGSTFDDGFSIACDDCSRWCHAACFDIVAGEVPEEWRCWVCVPRPVDRERARLGMKILEEQAVPLETTPQQQQHRQRKTSPGLDRKHRRTSAAAIDGSKRKRRASFLLPPTTTTATTATTTTEDDPDVVVVVDIDEPPSNSYVHITNDIVPARETQQKLTRHAQSWRGITALSSFPPTPPPPVTVNPLPHPPHDPGVRPPTYAVHTTAPVPSASMIAPFTSTITPSSTYLSDPLNAYAHLGLPKPFVHLLGPPLDLALDARSAGGETRFVRSGCRPNAVLRPVLCRQPREGGEGGERPKPQPKPPEDEEGTLAFAVFALRDLKANEEIVLGWEWDDGHAIHKLPALIQTPNLFPPAHQTHLRLQMSNILHLLSSTFPACACGAHARDCALRQMERFVDGLPLEDPRPPVQAQGDGDGRVDPSSSSGRGGERSVDLGPLVGATRGFRTRERVEGSGGMGGVVMWDYDGDRRNEGRGEEEGPSTVRVNGRHRPSVGGVDADVEMVDAEETEDELDLNGWRDHHQHPSRQDRNGEIDDRRRRQHRYQHQHQHQQHEHELRPPDPPTNALEPEIEEKMPPKMRKRWIHREVEVRREASVEEVETAMDVGGGETWGWVGRDGKERKEEEGEEGGSVVMEDYVLRERMLEDEVEKQEKAKDVGLETGAKVDLEVERQDADHLEAAPPQEPSYPMQRTSSPAMVEPTAQVDLSKEVRHPLPSPSEPQAPPSPTPRSPSPSPSPSLPHPEPKMASSTGQTSTSYTQPKPFPSPQAPLPTPSTDSPSASFARLSLVSPVVSQLGRISTGVEDFEPGAPSPQILQLLKGDLRGLADLEGRDGGVVEFTAEGEGVEDIVGGGETETTPIALQTPSAFEDGAAGNGDHDERADGDTSMEDASIEDGSESKGLYPISDLTTSSSLTLAPAPMTTSAASPAAEALSLASPPAAAASPPAMVAVDDPSPPTLTKSSNAPDAPAATLHSPIPQAVETYSSALPHVEAPPAKSTSAVEADVDTTVAVSTRFSTGSPSATRSPTTAAEEMTCPASSEPVSSTEVPSLSLSPGAAESAAVEEEVIRSPTPSPMEPPPPPLLPETDTQARRSLTPPTIHVRTPTPPPAPKVKMSLKDYALRKQKRKEEQKAAGAGSGGTVSVGGSAAGSVEASPVVGTVGLVAEEKEQGTKEGVEDRVMVGRVNGIVVQEGLPEGGVRAALEATSSTVEQKNGVPKDEDVEMEEEVHYTPALVLPSVVLPRPSSTTNALSSTANLPPSTSKFVQSSSTLPGYSRSTFLPENPNSLHRSFIHAPTSARRRPSQGLFLRDQASRSSESLATSDAMLAASPSVVKPSHSPWHPPSSPWTSPSMFGRPFTFQAKAELLDQPLPTKLPSDTIIDPTPTPSLYRAQQKVNGDTLNSSRPLSERIGPSSTKPSPESTPRQRHQDPQEEGEVSLGEETPSPQPAPRRIRIDRTRFAPTSVKSPPTGPRALRSASPHHHRPFSVPMQHQSPPPPSSSTPTTPAPPAAAAARAPPTGPRAFRLGLGQQQQPRGSTPQGWSAMQRESWGKPEWARSRPA